MMKKIDMNTWKRKELYDFFSQTTNPFYMISFRVDVTELKAFTKKHNCSFYYSLVYLCNKALASVENFMYVCRKGELFLLDARTPSFTDMKPGTDIFHIVSVPAECDILEYCESAKKASEEQQCFIDMNKEGDHLAYFSCVPTLDLTGLTNEQNFAGEDFADDNIPRIAWGKYTEQDGRLKLTISMEVNHRFVDGVHIERFAKRLEELINEL